MKILKLIEYQNQKKSIRPIRLVVNCLLKNEADVVEDHVRFHAARGVDAFTYMDHSSTDGTREILQKLSEEFDITLIDQPDQHYRQSAWMTELAFIAKKGGADFIVNSDADEFWMPDSGNLKLGLDRSDSVIKVQPFNVALSQQSIEEGFDYLSGDLLISSSINFDLKDQGNINSTIFAQQFTKTIVNTHGMIDIKQGNHNAKHAMRKLNTRTDDSIKIYHYPVRGYQQFENRVKQRSLHKQLYNLHMGNHYLYWIEMLKQGRLKDVYQSFILDNNQIEVLINLGVVSKFTPLRNLIKKQS